MHPDDNADPSNDKSRAPEAIDAQFGEIVQRTYGDWYQGPAAPGSWPPPWQMPHYTPMPPAPPPRRWGRWIALGAGAVVLVCLAASAVVVVALPVLLRDRRDPQAIETATPARSPREGDPLSVRRAWVRERVLESLDRQGEALLSGDQQGYLSVADPELSNVDRENLLRQFRSLRAMHVAGWRHKVEDITDRGENTWAIEVMSTACFVTSECADGSAPAETTWRVDGATATLVSWSPHEQSHPWQTDEIVATFGKRTVVATTAPYQDKLRILVDEAEKAAVVADGFARADRVPSRYVIYFAGEKEWQTWFDLKPAEWSGGSAISVSDDRYEVVLNSAGLDESSYDELLRHELTHAASLPGPFSDTKELWWLIEGIAELAEMDGAPAATHPGIDGIADLIDDRKVTGLEVEPPTDFTADREVSAYYGTAFLGVSCIAERYGHVRLVQFFHTTVHDVKKKGTVSQVEIAAPQVLGVQWTDLERECFDYVRDTAG